MPAVTGRKGDANKARAVSRNGASEGSMRNSTEDSGPMKPGNRVEGKTLTIRKAGHGKNV
jgi:hypothetical protein